MSLATYDLFTDGEYALYMRIISLMNDIERVNNAEPGEIEDVEGVLESLQQNRKQMQQALSDLIRQHEGTPRRVRLPSVLNVKKFRQEDGSCDLPAGITWNTLKTSRRIAEFASEESRALGLKHQDVTFDKIIVKWKSLDVLEQIVLNGFVMPILNDDGSVTEKYYICQTASAGQLRTDKLQFIALDAWQKIQRRLQCGMDWDTLNKKGGINVNKLMAYSALPCSATDEWTDADIDRCIVIKDFEAPVTGLMQYIKPDYTSEIGEQTVMINHCDGIGMMLPSVSRSNFMVRAPWIQWIPGSVMSLTKHSERTHVRCPMRG